MLEQVYVTKIEKINRLYCLLKSLNNLETIKKNLNTLISVKTPQMRIIFLDLFREKLNYVYSRKIKTYPFPLSYLFCFILFNEIRIMQ